jgi:hypothetical protein
MGWSIGFDSTWNRDIGYGVPAECDEPECNKEIDRGLSYVCEESQPYGGDGCGLYFCSDHKKGTLCFRCAADVESYDAKPDTREWLEWKLTDSSWGPWRDENPEEVTKIIEELKCR